MPETPELNPVLDNPLKAKDINPASINQVYDKDPVEWTDEEALRVATKIREGRAKWAAEEADSKMKGKRRSTKVSLNINDLDLKMPLALPKGEEKE